ncbi:hypothetical protein ASG29_04545 [Sphingomonas sp. Leaf412]|uniref:DUF2059 domain-containing protein n=1 Tax=Sphingomonas sp. Leaf412 TaxID=1736370 RepID=UPI0006F8C71F|nr:DUF2059 domain-containing protein [Sphingomonas sp. Leaf412]KQT33337.1 hypothetical protein ASG29_04545 [Sphingomonas sp. Leaf412]
MILLLLAAQAASPEAMALGERVAGSGAFSRLAPMVIADETEKLLRATPDLTPAEQTKLRAQAKATANAAMLTVRREMAVAYAKRLSIADLRAIAAFNESTVAARYTAATPAAVAAARNAMDKFDLATETRAAFCKDTGKLCTK